MTPPGMQPATLAKGYRWAHGGRNPKRDPERRATRAYTEHELRRALGALIADNPGLALAGVWGAVLQRLPLPSTRLLLSQQARLRLLSPTDAPTDALVDVAQHWLPLVSARWSLLRDAFQAQLGRPVALHLRGVQL